MIEKMLLDNIRQENDIKKIDSEDWAALAEEIREFLIQKISVTGGHLGSNLGAVELTMALHLALDLPEDKIVWDVGHQAYTHKIITGRKAEILAFDAPELEAGALDGAADLLGAAFKLTANGEKVL